jgi:hypothetical protein
MRTFFRQGPKNKLLQLLQADEITVAIAKLFPLVHGRGIFLEIVFGVRGHRKFLCSAVDVCSQSLTIGCKPVIFTIICRRIFRIICRSSAPRHETKAV